LRIDINSPIRVRYFLIKAVVQAFGCDKHADTPWQSLSLGTRKWLCECLTVVNDPVFVGIDVHARLLNHKLSKLKYELPDFPQPEPCSTFLGAAVRLSVL